MHLKKKTNQQEIYTGHLSMKQPLFPLPAIKINLIRSCSKTEFFLLPEMKNQTHHKNKSRFKGPNKHVVPSKTNFHGKKHKNFLFPVYKLQNKQNHHENINKNS